MHWVVRLFRVTGDVDAILCCVSPVLPLTHRPHPVCSIVFVNVDYIDVVVDDDDDDDDIRPDLVVIALCKVQVVWWLQY